MLPRALVLSADEKVVQVLQPALAGLGCEVQSCKEIFAAIEEVTRTSFHFLLIDWQEELEADFLLKTARGLKCNRATFAVALVAAAQEQSALDSGADATLAKPFTAEQAQALLGPRLVVGAEPDPVHTRHNPELARPVPPEPARPAFQNYGFPVAPPPGHCEKRQIQADQLPLVSTPVPRGCVPAKFSRTLSLTAIVWPAVIALALLAFDQWSNFSQRGFTALLGMSAAAHARIAGTVKLWAKTPSSSGEIVQTATMPITNDLLADYARPASQSSAASSQMPLAQTAEEIDLASVEALPPSTRLLAAPLPVEHQLRHAEIPNSLRFPPPMQSPTPVTPKGDLIAPDWAQAAVPVTLPEAVSRLLLERQVMPSYPPQALNAGVGGTVVLQASIAADGTIRDLKVVSGYLVLARAAFDAVKQWRYKPYRRNGERMEVETLITVDFKRPPRG